MSSMTWFFLKCWPTSSALSGGRGDWCARSAWELTEHGICLRQRYCEHKTNFLVFWTSILGWNLLILVLQGYGGASIWMCCSIHRQSDWAESKACRCHISQVIGAIVMRIFQKMSFPLSSVTGRDNNWILDQWTSVFHLHLILYDTAK